MLFSFVASKVAKNSMKETMILFLLIQLTVETFLLS
jgi:hypothetical protein